MLSSLPQGCSGEVVQKAGHVASEQRQVRRSERNGGRGVELGFPWPG